MKVNRQNYYANDTNKEYWSASLVKSFLSCPARAVAELNGEWQTEWSEALLVGSYVDAAFESQDSFDSFCAEHPEMFNSRTGELKAPYRKADEMIARAKSDPVFMQYMTGKKQVIKTGTVFGLPFKAKFDVYRRNKKWSDNRIVDLKTVKDMKPVYVPEQGMVDFATRWNWPLQGAIYQAIDGHHLPFYLAVITKEDPPEIDVIQVEQSRLDAEMAFLEQKMPLLDAMKQGIIEPERCGKCAYCRATKKLTGPRLLSEVEFDNYG